MYVMDDRLTLEQRRVVASLMEVYVSPTVVRQKFAGRDPPSRLAIYHVYAKFVTTGSAADNYRGNVGWPRTGRSDLNIAVVQQAISQSPSKSTTRCSLEADSAKTVWRILTQDLGMRPYHIQVVQALTAVQKRVRVECCQILAEMTNIQPDIVNLMAFSDEANFHTSGHVN
jgi:hypothetical protein